MGVLGDIAALITTAWRILQDVRDPVRVRPQELFNTYVAPSYALLKVVHADYLDLYHELAARIHLEDDLSSETVRWFSRARTVHQVDRSELRVLDIPGVRDDAEYGQRVSRAVSRYLWEVREYIAPREADAWRASHRYPWAGSSASTRTEVQLRFLANWLHMTPIDRRVLLAEDSLRPFQSLPDLPTRIRMINQLVDEEGRELLSYLDLPTRASMLNQLLSAATDDLQLKIREDIEIVNAEAARTYPDGNVLPKAPPGTAWNMDSSLRWRAILQEHIDEELSNFQEHIGNVQQAYMQVRVLTDRASNATTT